MLQYIASIGWLVGTIYRCGPQLCRLRKYINKKSWEISNKRQCVTSQKENKISGIQDRRRKYNRQENNEERDQDNKKKGSEGNELDKEITRKE